MQDKSSRDLRQELDRLEDAIKRRDRALSDINRIIDEKVYTLTVVKESYRAVSSILDHTEIVTAIMDMIKGVLKYDISGILLYGEERGSELVVELMHPSNKRFVDNFNSKLFRVAKKELSIPLDREKLVFKWKGESANLVRKGSKRSKASHCKVIILKSKNKKLGLLGIARADGLGDFSEDDLNLFSLIGNQSAIGIGNALSHERAQELAITDELTKCYTRRHFRECLEEEIRRAKRYKKVFSLAMFDIDDFKVINDRYGHVQGDKVLIEMSKLVKNTLRDTDLICRYGAKNLLLLCLKQAEMGLSMHQNASGRL